MIIDKLKSIDMDKISKEQFESIDGQELLKEIVDSYVEFHPVDWNLFSSIPEAVTELMTSANDEQNTLYQNPFYEKMLIQIFYLEAKGMAHEYIAGILATINPAQFAFEIEKIIAKEDEYQFLKQEYDRYVQRSLSLLQQQVNLLESFNGLQQEDFETVLNQLKEFTGQGDK